MYKILVNEAFIEMEADNVEIQNGTLIFYFDKEKTKVRSVVPVGWKYFEIMEEENALFIGEAKEVPIQSETISGEEIRRTREEALEDCKDKGKEEETQQEKKVDVSAELYEISKGID